MEVVQPQPQLLPLPRPPTPAPRQREVQEWERKKAKEYEDIDGAAAAAAAMFRSVSVPKDLNFGGGDVHRLPRKANSVQCLMRMAKDEDEDVGGDDEEEDDDDEEEEEDDGLDSYALWAKFVEEGRPNRFFGGKPPPIRFPPCAYNPTPTRSIDDDSEEQVLVPPPSLGGLWFMKAGEDQSDDASMRRDVECVLNEYNRLEGVDYEYVKTVMLRLTSSPESDPYEYGRHINFFAKRRGPDACPEFFFASLSTYAVHCCKLNYDPTVHTVQHCEHVKCSECHLWTYRKK